MTYFFVVVVVWRKHFSSGLEIKICPRLEITVRAAAKSVQTVSYAAEVEKAYSYVENLTS